jgi:hypothetical protein
MSQPVQVDGILGPHASHRRAPTMSNIACRMRPASRLALVMGMNKRAPSPQEGRPTFDFLEALRLVSFPTDYRFEGFRHTPGLTENLAQRFGLIPKR